MRSYKARPAILKMWSERSKCWMCKHKFAQPVTLSVEKPERGKFQPNINSEVLWHLYDTHGLPPEIVGEWIIASVYGMEKTEMGVKV